MDDRGKNKMTQIQWNYNLKVQIDGRKETWAQFKEKTLKSVNKSNKDTAEFTLNKGIPGKES